MLARAAVLSKSLVAVVSMSFSRKYEMVCEWNCVEHHAGTRVGLVVANSVLLKSGKQLLLFELLWCKEI